MELSAWKKIGEIKILLFATSLFYVGFMNTERIVLLKDLKF